MAIVKSVTKFVNNIESIYVTVLEKVIRGQIDQQIAPLGKEVSNYITEHMRKIRLNGGLLFVPSRFEPNQKFSSMRYNNIMSDVKIDLETLLMQMNEVVDLANLSDSINQLDFTENIAFANENKAKIRNLKTLFDSKKEFNGYRSNSFVRDDNTYDDAEFRTVFSNGMHKIQPFEEDIIANDENDASVKSVILNEGIFERRNDGDIFSIRLLDGRFISAFSVLPANFEGTINGELIQYPGMIIAYRIELSDIRQVNSISFSYFSNSEIDVLNILYTDTTIIDLTSQQWQVVENLYSDPGNFGSIEYNFDTISAKEIVVIMGQKFVNGDEVSVTDDEMNKFLQEYDLNNTLENAVGKLQMIDDITDNSFLNVIKRDKLTYKMPSKITRLDNKLAAMFEEFTKKIYGTVKRFNDFGGFVYYVNIFNLRVKKLQYKQFSIYESDTVVQKGSLINSRIAKTEKIPDGTWINYYVLYGNNKIRVIEKGDVVKDIITVSEVGQTVFETDFLIDATQPSSIVVLQNGDAITNYGLDLINSNIARGIVLDTEPNFNDVIVVQYNLPLHDEFGIPYKPWNVDILSRDGKPNIRDNSLMNITNVSRSLVTTKDSITGSGLTCAYPISSRFKYDDTGDKRIYYLHKDDVFAEQAQHFQDIYDPEDGEHNFALHDLIEGPTPSGNMYKIPQFDTTVSGEVTEYIQYARKDIYYGIVSEQVTGYFNPLVLGAAKVYETDNEYVPGTLKIKVLNEEEDTIKEAEVLEYSSTTSTENFDKNKFTIDTTRMDADNDILLASYVPIDVVDNPDCISNILEFNDIERFESTNNKTIKLTKYPFIDYSIIAQSVGNNAIWEAQNNVYSLKDNVSVRYVPMEVRMNGERPMQNVTDFVGRTTPDFSSKEYIFDPSLNNYMYYIHDDTIVFNTHLLGNIEIRYFTLNDRIKLRAELYRYDLKKYDRTPELYDILVLTNTI